MIKTKAKRLIVALIALLMIIEAAVSGIVASAEESSQCIYSDTKLMSEPSLTSNILGTLVKGQIVTVLSEDEDFKQVMVGDTVGYVQSSACDEEPDTDLVYKEPGEDSSFYCVEYGYLFPVSAQYDELTADICESEYVTWLTAYNESSRTVRANSGTIELPMYIFGAVNETQNNSAIIVLSDDVVLRYHGIDTSEMSDDELFQIVNLSVDVTDKGITFKDTSALPEGIEVELGFREPTKLVQNSKKLVTNEEAYGNFYYITLDSLDALTYIEEEVAVTEDVASEDGKSSSHVLGYILIILGIGAVATAIAFMIYTKDRRVKDDV